MPLFVDLINQVQKVLPTRYGGTGNEGGYARERLVLPYMNDTGGAIARGTLVKMASSYSDRRVTPTTTANEQTTIGVVVGRYKTGDVEDWGAFEEANPAHQETVAVCVQGRCVVLTAATVTKGQYAYPSATDGMVEGSSIPVTGTIGIFESDATGVSSAWLRFTGSSAGAPTQYYDINFIISAGGASIPALGSQAAVNISAPGTIVAARMLALSTGSAVVDIEKATYSGYPTTSSICGSFKPTLSGASKSEDTTLSGWTTALAMGDVLLFQLDSMSSIFVVTCSLKVRRS